MSRHTDALSVAFWIGCLIAVACFWAGVGYGINYIVSREASGPDCTYSGVKTVPAGAISAARCTQGR